MKDSLQQSFKQWISSLDWQELLVALEFEFVCVDDCSVEEELLREMIKLQVPPPTPIHPRALSFRPHSASGATDGRNEEERIIRDRFRRPRLFQWIERHSLPRGKPRRSRNGLTVPSFANIRRFDVIARQWVTLDGERLSLSCTKEQREADERILEGTMLVAPLSCTIAKGKSTATSKTYCRFVDSKSTKRSTREILRMLHVASRGHFLSVRPPGIKKEAPSYTASWFDPTNRWFSLSMYLASRFEVALWTSFQKQRRSSLIPPPMGIDESLQKHCNMSTLTQAFIETIMVDILPRDVSKCQHVRDSIIWKVLQGGDICNQGYLIEKWMKCLPVQSMLNAMVSCLLVEVGSPRDQLRRYAGKRLQVLLAREMEKSLLQDLLVTETQTNLISKSASKSKKKKRKNRKKKASGNVLMAATTLPATEINDNRGDSSSEEGREASPPTPPIAFLENGTKPRDRNRNIMFALSILDNIIDVVVPVQHGHNEDNEEVSNSTWIRTGEKKDVLGQNSPRQKLMKPPSQVKVQGAELDPRVQTRQNENPQGRPTSTMQTRTKAGEEQGRSLFQARKNKPEMKVPSSQDPKKHIDANVQFNVNTNDWKPKTVTVPLTFQHSDYEEKKGQTHSSTPYLEQFSQVGNAGGRWPSDGNLQVSQQPYKDSDNFFSSNDQNFPDDFDFESATAGTPLTAHRSPSTFFDNNSRTLAGGFAHRPESMDFAWGVTDSDVNDWGRVQGYPNRDRSILSDFFPSQDLSESSSRADIIMASSTAASIASSSDKRESDTDTTNDDNFNARDEELEDGAQPAECINPKSTEITECAEVFVEKQSARNDNDIVRRNFVQGNSAIRETITVTDVGFESQSASPQAPLTPSPKLSPILVSLADLKEIRKELPDVSEPPRLQKSDSFSSVTVTSLPNSPRHFSNPKPGPRMVSSLSRDNLRGIVTTPRDDSRDPKTKLPRSTEALPNLRKSKSRDDQDIRCKTLLRRSTDALSSYRNVTTKVGKSRDDHDIKQLRGLVPRPSTSSSYRNVAMRDTIRRERSSLNVNPGKYVEGGELCARSETAIDRHDDYHTFIDNRRNANDDVDNNTVTKDGSTTIISALSHREPEENSTLREERDTYRDLCLTLGAEVAMLKNMVAAQKVTAVHPALEFSKSLAYPVNGMGVFDPESVSRFQPRAHTLAAMSDAGYRGEQAAMSDAGHRGEHESLASEDDVLAKIPKNDNIRQVSSGATIAGSDVSGEHNSRNVLLSHFHVPLTRELQENASLHGMQSRLTRDILQFLNVTNSQLRKLDAKMDSAIERMGRLVKTVWPRAQVKLYGSHVTGLCLPSSDLDFVVCLPAVHKNAPAVAPGPLEGRNAINETSQRVLSRKLKGESWIDPRSLKMIDRTVVPVIKVATKDTRARTLQLDITFDGPGHHGLEAVHMVKNTMEELPMLRPLVILLKQFLLDRGLLTAYTGGLSSHCLFLMVARYLQSSSWGDCGSLLMGFLDFYGNHFDPRTTGISVHRRQYFARPNYTAVRTQTVTETMWNSPHSHACQTPASVSSSDGTSTQQLFRRNSFSSEKGAFDARTANRTMAAATRPPRFRAGTPPGRGYLTTETPADQTAHRPQPDQSQFDSGMPYTFDPLFVEDPLSAGNNVGRNAFRIFQVQRAFSDAHRALIAALEWDVHSHGEELQNDSGYTLLKCLLQSEDVFFDI